MDTLYLSFRNSADITIPFPSQLHVERRGVALVDAKGDFEPRQRKDETYYLCCDFVQNSYLNILPDDDDDMEEREEGELMTVASDMQQFPILRCLPYKNTTTTSNVANGDGGRVARKTYGGRIKETFGKLLFLPVNRSPIDAMRLYIINSRGEVPSFTKFDLTCTLLFVSN